MVFRKCLDSSLRYMVWLLGLVLCRAGVGLLGAFQLRISFEMLSFPWKGTGGSGRHWVNPSQWSAIVTGPFLWSCCPVGWPLHIPMLVVIPSLGSPWHLPLLGFTRFFLALKGISAVPGWARTTNLSVNSRTRSPIAPQRLMSCVTRGAELLTVFSECCWWCLGVLNNDSSTAGTQQT